MKLKEKIRCEVISVLREARTSGDHIIRFQIVRWNDGAPVLEKRSYRMTDDGEVPLRLRGWTDEDAQLLQDRLEEILDMLNEAAR